MKKMPKLEVAKAPKEDSYDDYKIKDAAETIMRAHEHMEDPEMMKRVGSHIAKKKHAIDAVHDKVHGKKKSPKSVKELKALKKEKDEEMMESGKDSY